MARNLTAAAKAAILADRVRPVFIFYADFASGALRVWNGYGPLSWDSQTWSGLGDFGGIDSVEESTDLRANGAVFTLNGVPSASVSNALTDNYQGRTCTLWLGLLNVSTGALLDDPYPLFGGRMDVMTVNDGPDTATITLQAENLLIDLNRSRERRYTHEDQQIDYPGDLGLELLTVNAAKSISWGIATPAPASGGTSKWERRF